MYMDEKSGAKIDKFLLIKQRITEALSEVIAEF
jgi:hypothetical protein